MSVRACLDVKGWALRTVATEAMTGAAAMVVETTDRSEP